jgi:hypothetical protein
MIKSRRMGGTRRIPEEKNPFERPGRRRKDNAEMDLNPLNPSGYYMYHLL